MGHSNPLKKSKGFLSIEFHFSMDTFLHGHLVEVDPRMIGYLNKN
jgi:hypothetical protein